MVIKGCATIAEYKEQQKQRIDSWIAANHMVKWEFQDPLHIIATDTAENSIIVPLDRIP